MKNNNGDPKEDATICITKGLMDDIFKLVDVEPKECRGNRTTLFQVYIYSVLDIINETDPQSSHIFS